MSYTVRSDPALMRPYRTVSTSLAAPTTAPTTPTPVTSCDDGELWVMNVPPPATPPPGAEPGDAWIDVATGDVYVLDQ